jgi:hypothetical protein
MARFVEIGHMIATVYYDSDTGEYLAVDDNLAVREQVDCEECDGWGRVDCSLCYGTGDDPLDDEKNCPECGGLGDEDCAECMGEGSVWDESQEAPAYIIDNLDVVRLNLVDGDLVEGEPDPVEQHRFVVSKRVGVDGVFV